MNPPIVENLRFFKARMIWCIGLFVLSGCLFAAGVPAPKEGETAPDFELPLLGKDTVKLSEISAKNPVVLVVLRGNPGYQCPLCSAQFQQFQSKAEEFKKAGANVLFVYPGPSDKLKDHALVFARGREIPPHFQIALDPDYTFTNAYKLRWDSGNETAYPSTFVVDRDRKVLFAKVSMTHGNRANPDEVLKAIAGK